MTRFSEINLFKYFLQKEINSTRFRLQHLWKSLFVVLIDFRIPLVIQGFIICFLLFLDDFCNGACWLNISLNLLRKEVKHSSIGGLVKYLLDTVKLSDAKLTTAEFESSANFSVLNVLIFLRKRQLLSNLLVNFTVQNTGKWSEISKVKIPLLTT